MAPDTFAQAFVDRGLQVPLTPKTKKPSIKGPWLAAHANDELAAAILEGRKVETIINTFIDGHIKTHAIKGRIHCQFNQLKGEDGGTIAGLALTQVGLAGDRRGLAHNEIGVAVSEARLRLGLVQAGLEREGQRG